MLSIVVIKYFVRSRIANQNDFHEENQVHKNLSLWVSEICKFLQMENHF